MKLYVDDVRTPPEGWHLARTVREAEEFLAKHKVDEVSLDYMIGDSLEQNFAPVARFIAALPADRRPRLVHIHTASSHGARELYKILDGAVADIRTRQF